MSNETTIIAREIEVYPSSEDKNKVDKAYEKLRDYQYNAFKYANEVIRMNYFTDVLKTGIGNENNNLSGQELKEKLAELTNSSERNLPYKYASDEYKNKLPSTILTCVNSETNKDYKNSKIDFLRGNASLISYKRNMPVPFQSSAIGEIKKKDKGKNFYISFMRTKLGGVYLSTRLGRDNSNNEKILERIVSGEYKLRDSKYRFKTKKESDTGKKKQKLFLLLTLEIPVNQHDLDKNKVLGIDMGINIPLYASVGEDGKKRSALGSREYFLNRRRSLDRKYKRAQKAAKDAQGGRGRKKKLKKLEKVKDKERGFVKDYNHQLSRRVVDFAVEHNCGVIHLEYLNGIFDEGSNDFILRNWSYFELQSKICNKAKKEGIEVLFVNPENTSKKCSECGHVDDENRKEQSEFKCVSCGFETNADHNAAKNIANRKGETYEAIKKRKEEEQKKKKKEKQKQNEEVYA